MKEVTEEEAETLVKLEPSPQYAVAVTLPEKVASAADVWPLILAL